MGGIALQGSCCTRTAQSSPLTLEVDDAFELLIHPLSWTPLPSLRSLSIRFGGDGIPYESYGAHLVEILRGAPRLVALQIDEIDAPEVIEFISTHKGEEIGDGLRRKPLRLLILMIQSQEAETKHGVTYHTLLRSFTAGTMMPRMSGA